MPVLGGAQRRVLRDIDGPVSFSPDGKQFAFTRGVINDHSTVEIRIANMDGSHERLIAAVPMYLSEINGVAWSPDGKTIAASTMPRAKGKRFVLSAINVADGQIRELYAGWETIGRPAWMPDGHSLIVPMEPSNQELPTPGATQLWIVFFPSGELRRFTNDLSDYGTNVDVTRDGQVLAAMEKKMVSHIWVLPQGATTRAKQITSGETPDSAVAPGPNGKLLVRSGNGKMQLMDTDGSQRTPFLPDIPNFLSLSSCGDSYVVFDNEKDGTSQLWRTDVDGSNPSKLATEVDWAECSLDGKWVLYLSASTLYRIPIDGGPPKKVAYTLGGVGAVSPDGEWIAYLYPEGALPQWQLVVVPSRGGEAKRTFTVPWDVNELRWSPDGKGVQYITTRGGATNVWEQRLTGGTPRPITNFISGRLFDFSWTRDGQQLLLAKGDRTSNVVLFSNFQYR
jgi:Tol biopolymer transport system component